jgi:hypothetical protein
MEQDEHDPQIARIAAALRPLPAVHGDAKARVLVAVAAEREAQRHRRRRGWRAPKVWASATASLAAAASIAIWLHGGRRSVLREAPTTPPAETGSALPATLASRGAAAEPAPVPVELMLNAPSARHVRLVGDFTGWDAKGVEMRRDAASGLWSATTAVRPGRHVYAFIVDDSLWVRDPRAPVAPDSDFGQPGSLLIVGRP